jgi:hypothetical protein
MPFSTNALAAVPAEQILTSDHIVTTVAYPSGGWVQMDVSPEMLRAIKGGECRVWLVAVPHEAYERASGAFVSVRQSMEKGAGV